jgi:hypothetical protein
MCLLVRDLLIHKPLPGFVPVVNDFSPGSIQLLIELAVLIDHGIDFLYFFVDVFDLFLCSFIGRLSFVVFFAFPKNYEIPAYECVSH